MPRDQAGRILDSATVSHSALQGDRGVSEQRPAAWLQAVGQALLELLAKTATSLGSAVTGLVRLEVLLDFPAAREEG